MDLISSTLLVTTMLITCTCCSASNIDRGLLAHWPLTGDCHDYSGHNHHAVNHGVSLAATGRDGKPGMAARFNGKSDYLEIPHASTLALGTKDFSLALWVYTEAELDDVIGDLLSKYDPVTRRGVNLGVVSHAGMTSSQTNYRNLQFGIDSGKTPVGWDDCGRPGTNNFVTAMCVHEGSLYVGTFESDENKAGGVWRYKGGQDWEDCGSPDRANTVMSLAAYRGKLYAGTCRYNAGGSLLPASPNINPGGHVYRYLGEQQWEDCGRLGEADNVYALCVFQDELYGNPIYTPGVFRWDGQDTWISCGIPGGQRSMSLAAYNGALYNSGNGSAGVWCYAGGERWLDRGKQAEETQTYSFAIYKGGLYVGTWPSGSVFRHNGGRQWVSCGQLGEEKEVMGLAVYNGKLYGGTLPLAQVYRYEAPGQWTCTGQLDTTPDVPYRRAWTMAVYQGKLFAGTLPSGHVYALEAGKCATHDYELAPGWRHIAAVRAGSQLRLYVDGQRVATSSTFASEEYDLTTTIPLQIGFGAHDYFKGCMGDVRVYDRALTEADLELLATK